MFLTLKEIPIDFFFALHSPSFFRPDLLATSSLASMSITLRRNARLVESSLAKLISADCIVQSVKSTCTATSWPATTCVMPFEDTCLSNSGRSTFSPRTVPETIPGCMTSAVPGHAREGMVGRRGSSERQGVREHSQVNRTREQH